MQRCGVCATALTHKHCDCKLEDDDVIESATLWSGDGIEGASQDKYHCSVRYRRGTLFT